MLKNGIVTFGPRRAHEYYLEVLAQLRSLQQFPELGRQVASGHRGVRIMAFDAHVIVYRVGPKRLDVLRIAHGRSDWTRPFRGGD
jgi:plasmid stabilization system protein ParE